MNDFKGYWSEREKKIWQEIDWKARDYKEFPIEDDTFVATAYFYTLKGVTEKQITFVKYLRSNPTYPPYYGPVYTSELLEFMHDGKYCYPCFDGRTEGNYNIHDRFEDNDIADIFYE